MEITADFDCTTANIARCVDVRAAQHADIIGKQRNRAAGLSRADARCGDAAGVQHRARAAFLPLVGGNVALHRIAACRVKHDLAVFHADAVGLDGAGIGDKAVDDVARRSGSEFDGAAIGADRAVVFDQLVLHVAGNADLRDAVAGEIEGECVARREMHIAELRGNDAVIDHLRCYKAYQARFANGDAAVIDDLRICVARFVELQFGILHEAIVVDIGGCRDEAANVDRRRAADEQTVGVDEDDIAVSFQRAFDAAGLDVVDAVERDRVSGRLLELREFAGCDIETAPINDGAI